jgi:maleylacetoacetate isomerase
MVTLYDYWRSSAAYRVRIALNLAGIAYRSVPVDLVKDEQRSPENLARNPQGLVPTLEIDGLVLTQSVAILEYLTDSGKASFLPTETAAKARCRALAYAVAMEIAPVCNLSVRRYAAEISGGTVSADDWQFRFVAKGLQAFEAMLDHPAAGPFCHGDRVTLPDICLVPQVYNARRAGVDMAVLPRISAIVDALEALPAIAAAHPDRVRPPKPA